MTYVFDGFPGHQSAGEFAKFAKDRIRCPPDTVMLCQVAHETGILQQRFKKRLEVEADLSEEQIEQYRTIM